jgi:hypothetical protein
MERLELWWLARRAERVLNRVSREILHQRTAEVQRLVGEARQALLAA